jgi:hypothetical protein
MTKDLASVNKSRKTTTTKQSDFSNIQGSEVQQNQPRA